MEPDTMFQRLEARVAALERLGEHCDDPEDRRLDNLLRKFARSVEMAGWLLDGSWKWTRRLAPPIALLWFFGDEALKWLSTRLGGG
jgi:hypothetical protein